MKIQLPFISRKRATAVAQQVVDLKDKGVLRDRELVRLGNELSTVRASAMGNERQSALDLLKAREQLASSSALVAEKMHQVAALRAEIAALTEERKKLTDWIVKGLSGQTIYEKLPEPVAEAVPVKTATPGRDRVETDLEEAIRVVGRNPRRIATYVSQKLERNFEAETTGAGAEVARQFDSAKAEGETEAMLASK